MTERKQLSAEDEAIHQEYLAAMEKMRPGATGFASLTEEDHEAIHRWWEVQRRLRKEAERAVAIPGLDVIWWKEDPPLKVWTAHGVVCALGEGYNAINGYVCLPPNHSWRTADLQGWNEDSPEVSVHGGITFGPHVTGWIGFDTSHAWDRWSEEELVKAGASDEMLERSLQYRRITEDTSRRPDPWDIDWTADKLVAEVEDLARQVKEAS